MPAPAQYPRPPPPPVADIGNRDDLPIAALGQRPERPQIAPRRARCVVDLQPDTELVGPDSAVVEQAAEQRVARARDRVQRPGAVERISEAHRLRPAGAAAAIVDLDAVPSRWRATMRPAMISSRPSAIIRATVVGDLAARCGGGGRPTTAGHGAGSGAARSASRLCHSAWLCGRRLSTAARQPTSAVRRRSQRHRSSADRRRNLVQLDRRRLEIGMRARNQAAAGKRDDAPA